MKGYDFGQVGGNDGHAGVIHKFSRVAGAYPPNMWSKGGILWTPPSRRCRSPQQRARKKKKKLRVLGMGCGHLASASELNLKQVGARGKASRGRILPIPPFDEKNRGYTPV